MTEIEELIEKQKELKQELHTVQHKLCYQIIRFQGTLQEALKMRIIKLNFATPPGFNRILKDI